MTEDLTAVKGRVFVGNLERKDGPPRLYTVTSVRRNRAGTPTSCKLTMESPGVGGSELVAEFGVTLPKDGKLHGLRRVTLARFGLARVIADDVGRTVPTDAVVLVTGDRCAHPPDLFDT
jgi:hypothetical protein